MANMQISIKDPKTKVLVTGAAIALAILILCQKAIVKPSRVKLDTLKQKLEHIKLEDEIGKIYKEVISYENALSPQKDPSWLRMEITRLAQAAKIDINSIEPLPPKEIDSYSYVSFKVKSACTYSQLAEFIRLTETNPYFIRVESIVLESPKEYKEEVTKEELGKKPLAEIEMVVGTVYPA